MPTYRNATTIAPAFSNYSLAVEAPGAARWLHISGQVGVMPDGTTPAGAALQFSKRTSGLISAKFSILP